MHLGSMSQFASLNLSQCLSPSPHHPTPPSSPPALAPCFSPIPQTGPLLVEASYELEKHASSLRYFTPIRQEIIKINMQTSVTMVQTAPLEPGTA